MTSLVICGIHGRMGRTLTELAAARAGVRVLGGIASSGRDDAHVVELADAGELIAACDVVIDFSTAAATAALVERQRDALAGRALVVGTTGLAEATERAIDALAQRAAVLVAANFSIGVNVLLALTRQLAAVLDAARYDAEIVEAHHGGKADAPSGTALALARAVASGRGVSLADVRRDGRSGATGARPEGEIGLHAIRGGSVVGEHRVMFLGRRERVELVHQATDRALFAEGALDAAVWIAGRAPGRYDMARMLGLGGGA